MTLAAGDWIEVRSKEEILATLDEGGRLEGLPFMPEMLRFCGGHFQVFKSAQKTCSETVGPSGLVYVSRSLNATVHLHHRCDGSAHGGCQAGCVMFWKEAWLKPLRPGSSIGAEMGRTAAIDKKAGACTEEVIYAAAASRGLDNHVRYTCQATQLMVASRPLKLWEFGQYVDAVRSRNNSVTAVLKALVYVIYYYGTLARSPRLGAPSRWFYDRFQSIWGGVPFPRKAGRIDPGQPHPRVDLDLQPGDLVRVKSYEEILKTVDRNATNRGLSFDAELVPYCGKLFRVRTRIERFIDEKTGRMRNMKTPAVILENVYCHSLYSGQRVLCPRAVFLWWREIWLEKVLDDGESRIPEDVAWDSSRRLTAP